jgi:hypothetical protein
MNISAELSVVLQVAKAGQRHAAKEQPHKLHLADLGSGCSSRTYSTIFQLLMMVMMSFFSCSER